MEATTSPGERGTPRECGTPGTPRDPETPGTCETPRKPGTPETPGDPGTPGNCETPRNPETPGTTMSPGTPGKAETPETPEPPGERGTPGTPETPGKCGTPGSSETPGNPETPRKPGTPGKCGTSEPPGDPGTPEPPGERGTPETPGNPETPGDSENPEPPGERGTPGTPGEPWTPEPPAPPAPLESLRYRRGSLWILNQRLLPGRLRYERVDGVERAWGAIRDMEVRGAPAIALVGLLSLAVELARGGEPEEPGGLETLVGQRLQLLESARPTARNLPREGGRLRGRLREWAREPGATPGGLRERVIEHIEGLLERERGDTERLAALGAQEILGRLPPGGVTLLTHCNTGTLATVGPGTALGVVRGLHARGRLSRVFCTETRPFHQGGRLTALELRREGLPVTLIADSAAAAALRDRGVQAVVVGADRVAANGDTANKVGTFQLALLARCLRLPFYVATTTAACDPRLPRGCHIPIEERPARELTQLGGVCLAPPDVDVWNPAFDVTPHELITGGFITELGVFAPRDLMAALAERGAAGEA